MSAKYTIAGEWRGHYTYRKMPDGGCSFSAFFNEAGGIVSGSILDDAWPGKANISGTFSFPEVQFKKAYVVNRDLAPVEYEGVMSDDGKSLSGRWTIADPRYARLLNYARIEGNWTAHRIDEEAEFLEKVEDSVSTLL